MTPKEHSEYLISIFISNQHQWYLNNLVDGIRISHAKKCAILLVKEQIKDESQYEFGNPILVAKRKEFLNEVIKELEKL